MFSSHVLGGEGQSPGSELPAPSKVLVAMLAGVFNNKYILIPQHPGEKTNLTLWSAASSITKDLVQPPVKGDTILKIYPTGFTMFLPPCSSADGYRASSHSWSLSPTAAAPSSQHPKLCPL